jgi:TM2 domain-containing membrane protein YozV
MQAQGFGRKGAASGATAYVPPRPAPVPVRRPADDPYAALRADFIAQERTDGAFSDTVAWNLPTSSRSWSKSRLVAYLLWFFLGSVAGHRLYLGRYVSAVLQSVLGLIAFSLIFISPHNAALWGPLLLTFGMWRLLDLFLIPGMCRTPPIA